MSYNNGPKIVSEGLVLYLDAANSRSYSGSGTTWSDLSGNGYDFNVNASAYSTTGGIAHMNFEGSFGAAKRAGTLKPATSKLTSPVVRPSDEVLMAVCAMMGPALAA